MTPIHSMFVTETMILIVAFAWYVLKKKQAMRLIRHSVTRKQGVTFGVIGLTNVAFATLLYV